MLGPDGEPLLSAALVGEQLLLRVRNPRRFGLDVVIGAVGSDDLHGGDDGPAFKVSFDDRALQPLQAHVQDSQRLAFVADVWRLLGELNCTNRLHLHARRDGGGVRLQLGVAIDDLRLDRLVEPAHRRKARARVAVAEAPAVEQRRCWCWPPGWRCT